MGVRQGGKQLESATVGGEHVDTAFTLGAMRAKFYGQHENEVVIQKNRLVHSDGQDFRKSGQCSFCKDSNAASGNARAILIQNDKLHEKGTLGSCTLHNKRVPSCANA